eukprot:1623934-Rhodomonas_salina.1
MRVGVGGADLSAPTHRQPDLSSLACKRSKKANSMIIAQRIPREAFTIFVSLACILSCSDALVVTKHDVESSHHRCMSNHQHRVVMQANSVLHHRELCVGSAPRAAMARLREREEQQEKGDEGEEREGMEHGPIPQMAGRGGVVSERALRGGSATQSQTEIANAEENKRSETAPQDANPNAESTETKASAGQHDNPAASTNTDTNTNTTAEQESKKKERVEYGMLM